MINIDNKSPKQTYRSPKIEIIRLDTEISLILESSPPFGPDETSLMPTEYFNNDPFKFNLC